MDCEKKLRREVRDRQKEFNEMMQRIVEYREVLISTLSYTVSLPADVRAKAQELLDGKPYG
jgi:hypothetical protein